MKIRDVLAYTGAVRQIVLLRGINLGDNHVRAHAVSARGNAAPTPTIAKDDKGATGQQNVGRANNGVERTLSGAIAVVKHVFGIGFVDRQDGEAQDTVFLHAAQSNDTRGCLFHTTNDIGNEFSACGM